MPLTLVRGVNINYDIVGSRGPWIALSPGGRQSYGELLPISRKLAAQGYRVVLHDRRNCGASDVAIEGNESEYEIWADDLYVLLKQLRAFPAFIGGPSAGCRLSLLFALRHPDATTGLLLWRITGGHSAAEQLAERYYGQYVKIALHGGMAAVCATEHFRERIEARPENRDRLMKMDPKRFIEVMSHWREYFVRGADQPVIGCSEADLRSIRVPVCLIPGNDAIHSPELAKAVAGLLPNSEIHEVVAQGRGPGGGLLQEYDRREWEEKEDAMVAVFANFLSAQVGWCKKELEREI